MILIRFEDIYGQEIWINPSHIVQVSSSTNNSTVIMTDTGIYNLVGEPIKAVLEKIWHCNE